jgi:hypothetical protein
MKTSALTIPFLMGVLSGCGAEPKEETVLATAGSTQCLQKAGKDLCFRDANGVALVMGDISLGKTSALMAGAKAAGFIATDIQNLGQNPFDPFSALDDLFSLTDGLINGFNPLSWPSNWVPYAIDPAMDAADRAKVLSAIAEVERKTSIRFSDIYVYDIEHIAFVYFVRAAGSDHSYSDIGYGSGQRREVHLVPGGGDELHELGHVLGLLHEHQRRDRDEHVNFYSDRVPSGLWLNYVPLPFQITSGPYDIDSIMHYPSANYGSGYVLSRKDGSPIARRWDLSPGDVATLNELYPARRLCVGGMSAYYDANCSFQMYCAGHYVQNPPAPPPPGARADCFDNISGGP